MSLRKFLLIPSLIRHGKRASREPGQAWQQYWSQVSNTGAGGDVLWDGASEVELTWCEQRARALLNPSLPLVDVGCGNGRYSRRLAEHFPHVLGLDVAEAAVRRAELESARVGNVTFRVGDAASSGAGVALHGELGDANAFVRGVFHVLDPRAKAELVNSLADLVGTAGRLLVVETAFEGGALDYLEYLGADNGELPDPLRRCIQAGLPVPKRFGQDELERCFSSEQWEVLEAGPVDIYGLGPRDGSSVQRIPGFYAGLRPRR